jgi:hypothetical protein
VKDNNAIDDDLIDRTLKTWQPRIDHPLSRNDARQIIDNVSGFFSILAEWAKADATNDHAAAPPRPAPGDGRQMIRFAKSSASRFAKKLAKKLHVCNKLQ